MAAKLSLILCVLAIWAFDFGYSASHHAPAPSADCSSLILDMADCLSFVSNGSTVSKPEGTCCSGLKTVLKTDPACLCEAFKNSAQLGVVLNMTKAMTLPAACKVSAPSLSKCGLSLSPAGAPASSPALSPTTVGGSAGTTSPAPESGGATEKAPSPSPGNSASSMGFSAATLLVGLLVNSLASL